MGSVVGLRWGHWCGWCGEGRPCDVIPHPPLIFTSIPPNPLLTSFNSVLFLLLVLGKYSPAVCLGCGWKLLVNCSGNNSDFCLLYLALLPSSIIILFQADHSLFVQFFGFGRELSYNMNFSKYNCYLFLCKRFQ